MQNHLHIICFDVPFPANYGGAIDVFHKIRCLYKAGIKITLHCFEYGNRSKAQELENLCEKVFYYKRNTSFVNQFSLLPFNVKSRIHPELKQNLLHDNYPIMFEVLHTCYLLNDKAFANRLKTFRHSNIEHDYFNELAKSEKSFFKKIYLKLEAFKLKRFEKVLHHANVILSVSEKDLTHFKTNYPKVDSYYLPSFHQFDEMRTTEGKSNYILYHGNLSISENYSAVDWLIDEVFSKINFPIIIAGLNAPAFLQHKIKRFANITLKQNCTETEMQLLIKEAHIHCLYTAQATGLKLKLLTVLYAGKFVLANNKMLAGTKLSDACVLVNTAEEYIQEINKVMDLPFTNDEINKRKLLLKEMDNDEKTIKLIHFINKF